MRIFRLHPGLKLSFEHNSVRKNLFLSASFCWDSRLSLREMDQKIKFGGTLSYGDSHLEFLLRHFKVFSLHAILLDAAGVMRAHSGKWPGYFYMIVTWLGEDQIHVRSVTWLDFSFAFA